jgi:ABC-type antimicrobial peptide transport system permease subunit
MFFVIRSRVGPESLIASVRTAVRDVVPDEPLYDVRTMEERVEASIAPRTRELGIRMALGAECGDVLRMVARDGLTLACAGVALGVVAALGLRHFLMSMLFSVRPALRLFSSPSGTVLAAEARWRLGRILPPRNWLYDASSSTLRDSG